MQNQFKIAHYCHITDGSVTVDGTNLFIRKTDNFDAFLKSFYKEQKCQYPKFFKMDTMSKLAFMASEVLLNHSERKIEANQRTAMVFSNRSSSLDTDRKHQALLLETGEGIASPAIFVYTLPNIGMGEVAIRHSMQTENAFFVFPKFNAVFLQAYSASLLNEKKCDEVLCGWVEVDKSQRHGFFYLVSKFGSIDHTSQEIKKIYKEAT